MVYQLNGVTPDGTDGLQRYHIAFMAADELFGRELFTENIQRHEGMKGSAVYGMDSQRLITDFYINLNYSRNNSINSEISTGKMTAANAGHEYPAIGRAGGEFELMKDRHGLVLAGMEGARYREYEISLNVGDTIFVYTDGVPEATNPEEELYGTERMLQSLNCSPKLMMQIGIAVEEIYVNIAHYAYAPGVGQAVIRCDIKGEPKQVELEFIDKGIPFNPLAKDDADVTLSAEERPIGGLGIYMVKKSMDEVTYEYKDSQNHLWIRKIIN